MDLKFAFRTLIKTPWLTSVIIASLAAGIGANTVIFSWLRTVALNPLSAITTEPLAVEARNAAGVYVGSSWLELRDLREHLPSFAGLLAHRPRTLMLGDSQREERVWAEMVSA